MNPSMTNDETPRHSWPRRAAMSLLSVAWTAIRMPTLAVLLLLEPIVCGVLSGIATLGVLCALFFEFVVKSPNYPFWLMMGVSAGLALLIVPYYLLVRLFAGPSD